MSRKDEYINQNYLSRKVSRLMNECNHEIELETVRYSDHFHVYVTICNKRPPFIDSYGEGRDVDEREATRKALKMIYKNAYKI